jgi:hypothetical protein
VLATKRITRRPELQERIKPASVSLFFVNGSSDSIKIVANPEGIRALKEELDQAEKSIRGNKSYFFGDPLWMRSSSKLVAIEPTQSRNGALEQSDTAMGNTELAPRIFLFSLVMIALTLMSVGTITIFKWLF